MLEAPQSHEYLQPRRRHELTAEWFTQTVSTFVKRSSLRDVTAQAYCVVFPL